MNGKDDDEQYNSLQFDGGLSICSMSVLMYAQAILLLASD